MTRSRILVPIDFQVQSDLALKYAGHLATKLNAMISCIHVIEAQGLLADRMTGEQTKHQLRREAENKLSERVHSILRNEKQVPFEIIVTSGKVYQKVLEKAIDLNTQIILMGRGSSTRGHAKGLGSNTRRILAHSMVPVISFSRRSFDARKHLILPLDLTSPCNEQINWAVETALLFDAPVSAIFVTEKEQPGLRPVYLKMLEETRCEFQARNIPCTTHLLENQSTISREIVSFSDRTEHGILLLVTCYKDGSSDSFRGTIASQVLTSTEIPVLYVQPRNKFGLSLNRSSQYFQAIYPSSAQLEGPHN